MDFYTRLFGPDAGKLAELLPLFEVIPDWGNYVKVDLSREEYHANMRQGATLLQDIKPRNDTDIPFHPTPEAYRQELLFFFELFADLSSPGPDLDALRRRYWQKVYSIYDHLPQHVDPRASNATNHLIGFFDPKHTRKKI